MFWQLNNWPLGKRTPDCLATRHEQIKIKIINNVSSSLEAWQRKHMAIERRELITRALKTRSSSHNDKWAQKSLNARTTWAQPAKSIKWHVCNAKNNNYKTTISFNGSLQDPFDCSHAVLQYISFALYHINWTILPVALSGTPINIVHIAYNCWTRTISSTLVQWPFVTSKLSVSYPVAVCYYIIFYEKVPAMYIRTLNVCKIPENIIYHHLPPLTVHFWMKSALTRLHSYLAHILSISPHKLDFHILSGTSLALLLSTFIKHIAQKGFEPTRPRLYWRRTALLPYISESSSEKEYDNEHLTNNFFIIQNIQYGTYWPGK